MPERGLHAAISCGGCQVLLFRSAVGIAVSTAEQMMLFKICAHASGCRWMTGRAGLGAADCTHRGRPGVQGPPGVGTRDVRLLCGRCPAGCHLLILVSHLPLSRCCQRVCPVRCSAEACINEWTLSLYWRYDVQAPLLGGKAVASCGVACPAEPASAHN